MISDEEDEKRRRKRSWECNAGEEGHWNRVETKTIMCRKENKILSRTAKKERLLHPMATTFFSTGAYRVSQRVMKMSSNVLFWNKNSIVAPELLVKIVQVLFDKTSTRLKSSELAFYAMCAALLHFSKEYGTSSIKIGHSLLAFLQFWSRKNECMGEANTGGIYSQRRVLHNENIRFLAFNTRHFTCKWEGKEDAYFAPIYVYGFPKT